MKKKLQDFVTSKTLRFFKIMDLSSDFLEMDATTWKENESYMKYKLLVNSIKCVNDVAERGVALVEKYNKLHAKDETILIVVSQGVQKKISRFE